MAKAIVTLKVMPVSPETDMEELNKKSLEVIKEIVGETETKTEIQPVAFGLKSLNIILVMDESIGSPDQISQKISDFEEVNSCEVVDVRRAIG